MSRIRRHRKALGALATAMSVALLAACGGSSDSGSGEGGTNEVTVRADVHFTGAVLPLVAGVQTGIFEKHGLKVDLKEGTGSATTIQTVANGSDDMGYADAATMVQSVGQGMPVSMVAGMVQESPLTILTFKDSGIDGPEDLPGKTAGYTPGSAAERLFPAYAEATGIDEAKVTFRNVDIPTRSQLFLGNKADFTFGLTNVSLPNLELACDCELVSMTYADAAVDAFFKMANDSQLKPKQVADQWRNSSELLHTDNTADQGFGCTAAEDWEQTISMMEEYGDVPEGSVKVADAASNEYLPGDCTDSLSEK